MRDILDHRKQAARCRALAGGCLHQPTGDVLREIADEHDATAARIEAEMARSQRRLNQQTQNIIFG